MIKIWPHRVSFVLFNSIIWIPLFNKSGKSQPLIRSALSSLNRCWSVIFLSAYMTVIISYVMVCGYFCFSHQWSYCRETISGNDRKHTYCRTSHLIHVYVTYIDGACNFHGWKFTHSVCQSGNASIAGIQTRGNSSSTYRDFFLKRYNLAKRNQRCRLKKGDMVKKKPFQPSYIMRFLKNLSTGWARPFPGAIMNELTYLFCFWWIDISNV